ncbi:MAG: sigma-70 family RNA polymerase sigma factor [Planctomycetes bacterium]|nr:sigma-70 family RNA polymerase sigma factor [Planctomycetota bacterium]
MKKNTGAADREKLRRDLGDVYERLVQWTADQMNLDPEDVREPLHNVVQDMLKIRKPRIGKLENYLTRGTARAYRRSLGNGKKIKPILFSELSKEELECVFETPAPIKDPAEQAAENEILALAKQEIEKMSELRRDIMRLFFTGLSAKEIGAKLGMKATTVRSNMRHVKEFLVKKFSFAEEFAIARKRRRKPRTGRRAAKRRVARRGKATPSEAA